MLTNHNFTNNMDNKQGDEKLCSYFFKPLVIEVRLSIFQRTRMIALCDRSVAGMIVFVSMVVCTIESKHPLIALVIKNIEVS